MIATDLKVNFLKGTFIEKLKRLKSDAQPLWGIMTPQHMVEHLIGSVKVSNGKYTVKLVIPEDMIPDRKAFLMSEDPFPKNVRNPALPEGLRDLKYKNLNEAIEVLNNELKDFFIFFDKNPEARCIQPAFGNLNREEWIRFHYKHFIHHLAQFGLQ